MPEASSCEALRFNTAVRNNWKESSNLVDTSSIKRSKSSLPAPAEAGRGELDFASRKNEPPFSVHKEKLYGRIPLAKTFVEIGFLKMKKTIRRKRTEDYAGFLNIDGFCFAHSLLHCLADFFLIHVNECILDRVMDKSARRFMTFASHADFARLSIE